MFRELLEAAQNAAAEYEEAAKLLEYPEVQADKAWYLSVLEKYNTLGAIKTAASALSHLLAEEVELRTLLSDASETDKESLYAEISALLTKQSDSARSLCELLGVKGESGGAYCRMLCSSLSAARVCEKLYALIKADLISCGAEIKDENIKKGKGGFIEEINFISGGAPALSRLSPLCGSHRAGDGLLSIAATPAKKPMEEIDESQLKTDIFHSSGAGGQNINKVETAVRITHLPTGISVVCQDERSQLKNRRRAYQTLIKRLEERQNGEELLRQSADIARQLKIKSPLSFDPAGGRLCDGRLDYYKNYPFPMSEKEFTEYIDCLIATGK